MKTMQISKETDELIKQAQSIVDSEEDWELKLHIDRYWWECLNPKLVDFKIERFGDRIKSSFTLQAAFGLKKRTSIQKGMLNDLNNHIFVAAILASE